MAREGVHGAVNSWQEHGDPDEPTQIEINGRCYRMLTSFYGNESRVVVEPLDKSTTAEPPHSRTKRSRSRSPSPAPSAASAEAEQPAQGPGEAPSGTATPEAAQSVSAEAEAAPNSLPGKGLLEGKVQLTDERMWTGFVSKTNPSERPCFSAQERKRLRLAENLLKTRLETLGELNDTDLKPLEATISSLIDDIVKLCEATKATSPLKIAGYLNTMLVAFSGLEEQNNGQLASWTRQMHEQFACLSRTENQRAFTAVNSLVKARTRHTRATKAASASQVPPGAALSDENRKRATKRAASAQVRLIETKAGVKAAIEAVHKCVAKLPQ